MSNANTNVNNKMRLCINKDLLYSTWKYVQCYVAAWMGGEFGAEWIHESLCCSPETIRLFVNRQYKVKSFLNDLIMYSVQFSRSVVCDSLRPHGLQHARLPCPSPTPRAYSNSCPLSQWCHPTISSSVIPFSSCPQSFPASGSFPKSQFFASGGQSIDSLSLL